MRKFSKGDDRRNAVTAVDSKALVSTGWTDNGVVFYLKTATKTAIAAPTP